MKQTLEQYIAACIVAGTRKFFGTMFADYQEQQMSTPTTSTLNGGSTFVPTQTSDANKSSEGINVVEATRPRPSANQSINAGMTVPSPLPTVTVKQTDHKALAGTFAGRDFRANPGDVAKVSLDRASDNGGPRKDVGQFKSSRFESQPSTQTFAGNLADSDAGN